MGIETKLGTILTGPPVGRDAVHVAVIEVVAGHNLMPGDRVRLIVISVGDRRIPYVTRCSHKDSIGIIDPFIVEPLLKGERCFLWLKPGTVTGMRHHWEHPAFNFEEKPEIQQAPDLSEKENAIQWMHTQARILGCDFEDLVGADSLLVEGKYLLTDQNEDARDHWYNIQDEFWEKRKLITGEDVPDDKRGGFTCSC